MGFDVLAFLTAFFGILLPFFQGLTSLFGEFFGL